MHASANTITQFNDPLGFRLSAAAQPSALFSGGSDTIKVEARQMAVHQKEAVVTCGEGGSKWRLASDEGKPLRGTDLAPFPLAFSTAGFQSDLSGRIRALAAQRAVALDNLRIRLVNKYWLTGSFAQGTGEGHADPADLDVEVATKATAADVKTLIRDAIHASPAMSFLRHAVEGNTFALYVNGRRCNVAGVPVSSRDSVADPFLVYAQPPRPPAGYALPDILGKTGKIEEGEAITALPAASAKVLRRSIGEGVADLAGGTYETDTWLGLPAMTHYRVASDESGADRAPSGLALLSAGIAFCYMTQLSRYIESMKMNIRGARLVQFTAFEAGSSAQMAPIDTHLFLNGEAPEETHLQLLTIAARTCYLHATARTAHEPLLRIICNGEMLDGATSLPKTG